MRPIIRKKFGRYDNGRTVIRAEVVMDSAADLPSADSFEGYRLSAGSIAWAVNSSTIYAMNSAGEWIEQNGGE